eukprot:1191601-Prorocentrum_minimum.AAC.2
MWQPRCNVAHPFGAPSPSDAPRVQRQHLPGVRRASNDAPARGNTGLRSIAKARHTEPHQLDGGTTCPEPDRWGLEGLVGFHKAASITAIVYKSDIRGGCA